jgi:hypothetical protein
MSYIYIFGSLGEICRLWKNNWKFKLFIIRTEGLILSVLFMKQNFELKQWDRIVLSVKWLAMECVIGVQFLGEAGIELFTTVSRPALGMFQSPVQWDQVLLPEGKAPGGCRVTTNQCLVVGWNPVEFYICSTHMSIQSDYMWMQFELMLLSGDISWFKWCTKQCSDVGRTMIQRSAHCWQNIENE